MDAEIADRDVEGWDAAVPGMVWPHTNAGSANTSATAQHPCIRAPKRFNPRLEPNRCPHADLIILPTEEIFVAAVLTVQIIYAGG